MDVYKNVLCRD